MATPTYKELMTLAKTSDFLDRAAIAVSFYAEFIINEDPASANHNQRINWAKQAIINPTGVATQIASAVALDPIFKNQNPLNLASTPDSGAGSVQVAVENTINNYLIRY